MKKLNKKEKELVVNTITDFKNTLVFEDITTAGGKAVKWALSANIDNVEITHINTDITNKIVNCIITHGKEEFAYTLFGDK